MSSAKLSLNGKEYELPVVVGSEAEVGVDIAQLRAKSGAITLDSGYGNTGSCKSAITFIDGDTGILRYRGYPIEELAQQATFTEVAYLLIHGELPSAGQLSKWDDDLHHHMMIHQDMVKFFEGFPPAAHPMAVLSAMVGSLVTYYPDSEHDDDIDLNVQRLLAKTKTIAAFSFKKSIGHPFVYPLMKMSFCANFLRMMFANPTEDYVSSKTMEEALNLLLILHADHEQNCSTSTVRMVGSSQANLFASISAGICALSGPLHGGANQEVIEMLEQIDKDGGNYAKYVELAKKKDSGFRLMGFGHRVYKNFDPRATLLKGACHKVLSELGVREPLLEIAMNLEAIALKDDFFIERKLYPNVDFYSGIIYRAMGFPTDMFTVLFALGRMPGWIAHWLEMREEGARIHRPRQIYTGATLRHYAPKA